MISVRTTQLPDRNPQVGIITCWVCKSLKQRKQEFDMEESQDAEDVYASEPKEEQEQEIWSWGAGTDGQLGTAKLEDEDRPQLLHLPSLFSAGPISTLACGGAHVIAMTSGGRVFTWGRGTSGQLGHGDMLTNLHPKLVDFLEAYTITHVSAGWSHSGFVSDKGCLFTCGDGSFGQLGHGDYESYATPCKVSSFDDKHVEQIACGMRHSVVLLRGCSGNQVFAFGSGKRGQLGISSDKIKSVNLPQLTCGFENIEVLGISANGDHSAALSADGNLYTWGRGFAGASDARSPKCVVSSSRFISVAVGWNHALLLTGGGEVFMLGGERHGVLSDMGSAKVTSDSAEAVLHRVHCDEEVKVVQVAAGAEHSVLLTADGALKTWGWGEHGQLGLGNTDDQTNPQAVGLNNVVQSNKATVKVYCGSGFTFAIRSFPIVKPHQII